VIPVGEDFDLTEKLTQSTDERRDPLRELAEWYRESGEVPEVLKSRFGKSPAQGPL